MSARSQPSRAHYAFRVHAPGTALASCDHPMPGRCQLCAILLVALCTAGCFPFAAPPTRSSLSVGPTLRPGLETQSWMSGRVGVAPLGAAGGELSTRPVDVVAGYVFDGPASEFPSEPVEHGGYVSVTYYPVASGGESGVGRVGIDTTGDVIRREDTGEVGGGASVGVEVEGATFVSGAFAESGGEGFVAGVADGEAGIALRASVGMQHLADETSWTALIGIGLRLPALAGFAILFPDP